MCSPSSPPPPDPYATAAAQNSVNQDAIKTAAQYNQINQNNPYGSMSYTGNLGSADRTQNVTLNPQLQSLLDTQTGNANTLAGMGKNLLDATGNIAPFNPGQNSSFAASDWYPWQQTGFDKPTQGTVSNVSAGPLQDSVAAGPIQGNVDPAQGQIQTGLNTSGVQRIAGPNQFLAQSSQAQNAAYNAQTGMLAPHEQQAQSQLQSQLAAQGIEQGTPAYNSAINNLQQSQDMVRQQAAASAVGVGNQQQQALFGENLSGSQAQFQQALQSGQFGNEAQALSFGQNLSSGQFQNAAQQQQFGQGLSNAQLANTAQQQQYAEGMGNAQLANSVNQQQFGQNAAEAQFSNQALAQQWQQQLQLQNASQSLYQQNFGNAQATQTQNLNALMALNNGQQIAPNQPSFNPYAQTTAAQAAPNLIGLAGQNYQTQAQAAASGMGSVFGAAGQLGAAGIAACWVAREVFGEDDPKWLRMRHWMLTDAPLALRMTYLRFGERIATFIQDKPELKFLIRDQMEAILG